MPDALARTGCGARCLPHSLPVVTQPPTPAPPHQTMQRSAYDGLDLGALDAMWEERAQAVECAKRRIDVRGVTRPPRDPFEREWLEAHDQWGDLTESEPLSPQQIAERRPTHRRNG